MPIHWNMELLTPSGYQKISSLLGKCTIWTGEEWSDVVVEKDESQAQLYSVYYYAYNDLFPESMAECTELAKDFYLFQCEDKSFKPLADAIQHRSKCHYWGNPFNQGKTDVKLKKSQEWHGSQTAYNVISDKPFVVDSLVLKNKEVELCRYAI